MNQYYQVLTEDTVNGDVVQAYRFDADGNLIEGFTAGDANGDGTIDSFDTDAFIYAILHSEAQFHQQYPTGNYWACDTDGDGSVDLFDIDSWSALLTGYGGGSAMVSIRCGYDGENQLTLVEPFGTPVEGQKRVVFTYDHLQRRVEKRVYTYTSGNWSATPTEQRRFVYYGNLLIAEIDCGAAGGTSVPPAETAMRTYTYGLDLAGQRDGRSLAGAAGIGGLLALHDADDPNDPAGDYVFCYDANGNVGQLVDLTPTTWSTDSLVARYAYDPYGNITQSAGDYAAENPIRFSTKYWDDETGLGYWLRRFYCPVLGRWLNRDPIGE
ncbi:MAG: hypothetical protein JW910_09235, partial [Anaerolineae bacterium]|nr:hypothetical protein [Anaerolineae bacterium]